MESGTSLRILNAFVPASLARKIEADLIIKGLASKSARAAPSKEAKVESSVQKR